jgi:two-component system sensor kinase FixL
MNAGTLTQILARYTDKDAIVDETLTDIAADSKRASDIIHRLRALALKEHAPQHGLDIDALVDEVAGLLQQDLVRRGITLERVAQPGLPTVTGDRIQLQQIFLNVLVNATEALATVERERRHITLVTCHRAPGLVEVSVRDSGVGGKDTNTEAMFDRFVTTKPGGLGMGLAISRSIATAHGGRIYAKANEDCGLTVYLELPADG